MPANSGTKLVEIKTPSLRKKRVYIVKTGV